MLTPRASTISERLCDKPSAVFNPLNKIEKKTHLKTHVWTRRMSVLRLI